MPVLLRRPRFHRPIDKRSSDCYPPRSQRYSEPPDANLGLAVSGAILGRSRAAAAPQGPVCRPTATGERRPQAGGPSCGNGRRPESGAPQPRRRTRSRPLTFGDYASVDTAIWGHGRARGRGAWLYARELKDEGAVSTEA